MAVSSTLSSAFSIPGGAEKPKNGNDLRLIEVLKIKLLEARGLPAKNTGSSDRTVFCLVKLDRTEVFQSSYVPKTSAPFFGDDFIVEVPKNFRQLHFYLCEQYSGRVPRPFAKVSFRKPEVLKNTGRDSWYPLKSCNRQSEVSGKICLEVNYQECLGDTPDIAQQIKLSVVDYCDLNLAGGSGRSMDLYALVTLQVGSQRLQTKKLRIPCRKFSKTPEQYGFSVEDAPTLTLDLGSNAGQTFGCSADGDERCVRFSLWHDMLGGFNSYFHGEVRIPVEQQNLRHAENKNWYYLKPRTSSTNGQSSSKSTSDQSDQLGSIRISSSYTVDHVLSAPYYTQLYDNIINSIDHTSSDEQPWVCTPAGLLEVLPKIDLESVARPLMKTALYSNHIRSLLRISAIWEMSQCQEVNTLFRSSSLSSKLIYELMKFVGHQYLFITLKPCIDKIYLEKKSCEVDPAKLKAGQSLEDNTQNLIIYTEQVFSRVVDSNHRCPLLLKEVFSDLREVAAQQFPDDVKVEHLVLSSFLVMRFFSAAILNPKLFGLRKENADPVVGRTLALISKLIQKLSNYVVSGHKLNSKESWLQPVLQRFIDDQHKLAMCKLLDRISCKGGDNSISGESISLLREGSLVQRFPRQKRCLELSWLSSKRRHCMLTETEFVWMKNKNDSTPLGRILLSEVTTIQAVDEERFRSKHVFQLATESQSLYLQATTSVEMSDWYLSLQKQCKRQRLAARQSTAASQLYEVDLEKELETIHMTFLEHAETLRHWKNDLDGTARLPDDCPPLPLEFCDDNEAQSSSSTSSPRQQKFLDSIENILCTIFTLEQNHREAIQRRLKQIKYGSKDNPIGDDNYLLLKARMQDPVTTST